MLIIGAKGFAKEVLMVLELKDNTKDLVFYDNMSSGGPEMLYNKYPVLRTEEEVLNYFKDIDDSFALGLGGTTIREKLTEKFSGLGGQLISVIAGSSQIGNYSIIGNGISFMINAVATNDVIIDNGCLIDRNVTIGHDSNIGRYSHLMPGVVVSGRCIIGDYCAIGSGAIILPDVKIGNNVVVGAGAVVHKNVDSGATVVGVPAKRIK